MLVRRIALILAASGLAVASVANAASAPLPSRVEASVTNPNYQDDGGDSTAIILGVVLVVLIGIAALVGGGRDSPRSP